MELIRNTVFKVAGFDKPQRILFVNPETDALAHIDIEGKGARPVISRLSTWQTLANDGSAEMMDDPYAELPFRFGITPAMESRKKLAWGAIEPLVGTEIDLMDKAKRGRLLAARAEELGLHPHSVRNWMTEYWQKGLTPSVLYGNRNKAGGPGKARVQPSAKDAKESGIELHEKRGAKRRNLPGVGVNVDIGIRRLIKLAMKRFYRKNKHQTLRLAYEKMMRQFFPEVCVVDDRGKITIVDEEAAITYRQFQYWARKDGDSYAETVARQGKLFYEKTMRPLLGNSTVDSIGPGYRYQIDATIADVYLVSKVNRQNVIGRPVVYVVIDVWSRLIVGLYVGLENASWPAAMNALYNVTLDKVAYCKDLGIEIEPDQWPNATLCATLLGDRGEMLSQQVDHLLLALAIHVENAPPYRADWKGVVESVFRTLQARLAGEMPGYVAVDYVARTDEDYRLDATLTLTEFTQLIVHGIVEHNTTPIAEYPMHNDLINDDVPPIPCELWSWGLKNRMGSMIRHTPEKVMQGLLPTDEGTIADDGLIFFGRKYTSEQPHVRAWFSNARMSGRVKVDVSYHPHNLDTVFIYDGGALNSLTLKEGDSTAWKLCVEEVLLLSEKAKKTSAKQVWKTLEKRMTHQKAIEEIVNRAKELKAELGPDTRPKTATTGEIRGNKAFEKALNRIEQFTGPLEAPTVNNKSQPPSRTQVRTANDSKPKSFARPSPKDLTDDD